MHSYSPKSRAGATGRRRRAAARRAETAAAEDACLKAERA